VRIINFRTIYYYYYY